MHSETKKIGDTLDRFVKNEIDQDFLKRSHMPFAHIRAQIQPNNGQERFSKSFMQEPTSSGLRNSTMTNSPIKAGTVKELAHGFKRTSENGHVPFAATQRTGKDLDARFRKDSLTKTSFAWKAPTCMK